MEPVSGKEQVARKVRVTFSLNGLSRGGGGILMAERAPLKVAWVIRVYTNPGTEMAYVEYDPNRCEPRVLIEAVRRTGLDADELSFR